jgi:DNA-binding cell septation regulator SpoVG
MNIVVKDFRFVEKGALKGFCTVRFPDSDFELRDCRIIQQDGQRAFVVGPQREYEKDGVKKYVALVWWGKESKMGEMIQKAVIQEYESKKHTQPSSAYASSDIPF